MAPRCTFWIIAFVFSVVAACGFQRDSGPMQSPRVCQAACPCDRVSPYLEAEPGDLYQTQHQAEPAVRSLVADVVVADPNLLLHEPPDDPCPLDCPECHCHVGHVLAALPEIAGAVALRVPRRPWFEAVVAPVEGSRADLFRPPRCFSHSATT